MPLDLPENQNVDIQTGSSVELPFPAPAFWVLNGVAALKAVGGALYFGGFACSAEKLQAPINFWEDTPEMIWPIPGLESTDIENDHGALPVFAARSLLIAPIGTRQFSTMNLNGESRRVAPFTKGARPGLQVLALLGYVQEKKVYPWAPVMLSPKGYQVNHVQKAISTWKNTLAPILRKAGAAPSAFPYFWMQIGTFGPERKQDMVGGAQKKPITPVSCHIPDDLDETTIERRYVGRTTAEWMNELADQANEWLHTFDNLSAKGGAPSEPEDPYGYAPEEDFSPPPEDDSIPF